jgi:hypothetical protein
MASHTRGTFWILLTAIISALAKIYCALTTFGTDDVELYHRYGRVVEAVGFKLALSNPIFNLTPLAAEYPAFLSTLLQGNERWFPFFLKLPGILASFGSVLALLWLQRRFPRIPTYGLILFAASPVAFMIDGFHGNFDSILVFLLLGAACVCVSERPSWLACAAFLALAAQVKVVALLVAPAYAFFWLNRGRGIHFITVTGLAILAGWLPGLLAAPLPFLKNVVGYGSVWGVWGVTYLFRSTGIPEFSNPHWTNLTTGQLVVSQILKIGIISIVVWAAWQNRKATGTGIFTTLTLCWMIFFSLAPGMGLQYMVWFAPFLLVWNARWYTGVTVLTSALLFAYYQVCCGKMPWIRADSLRFAPYEAVMLLPWATFVACAIVLILKLRGNNTRGEDDVPAPHGDLDTSKSFA